ncbi:uncharacterized protein LOC124436745 [Xenia sp. Carnegie-2017]|uniref:uncharacterized protein LOC124436745 n=1 Tax=Xenia sp. Carnegie-2017 TaxID=2897299 RepID=UPI001F03CA98|nr:uncharacterized protein LOC124436745 [Xenia sp. Carnegie-2017]
MAERNVCSIVSLIIALVFLMIVLITLGIFLDKTDDGICIFGKRGNLEFGMNATITALTAVIAMIFLNLFKNSSVVIVMSKIVLVMTLIAAGVVLAVTHASYNSDKMNTPQANTTFCDWLQKTHNFASCTYLIGASAVSFLAALALLFEASCAGNVRVDCSCVCCEEE